MSRISVLSYGVFSYLIFFATFLYAMAFLGGDLAASIVPKTIDSAAEGPVWQALAINVALLGVFAVQHSVMARPTFKKWFTQFIPEPIERSTYVLASSACLIAMFWLWQSMGGVIWHVENEVARWLIFGVYGLGWGLVLLSTFLINHFDLFGLRQVWLYFRGVDYTHLKFGTPFLYRIVRHPLYVGWITVFWAAPTMTVAHLIFAIATTAYILIAIQLEERNLVDDLEGYASYRKRVPMLIPFIGRKSAQDADATEAA